MHGRPPPPWRLTPAALAAGPARGWVGWHRAACATSKAIVASALRCAAGMGGPEMQPGRFPARRRLHHASQPRPEVISQADGSRAVAVPPLHYAAEAAAVPTCSDASTSLSLSCVVRMGRPGPGYSPPASGGAGCSAPSVAPPAMAGLGGDAAGGAPAGRVLVMAPAAPPPPTRPPMPMLFSCCVGLGPGGGAGPGRLADRRASGPVVPGAGGGPGRGCTGCEGGAP